MKLITEHSDNVATNIVEAKDGQKEHYIEGIFIQTNKPNHNRRIYPKDVMAPAVADYIENYVKANRAVGELNHPSGPSINLDKVSHRITSLEWDGDDVIGKAKILDTPMGKIVKGLLEGGCQLGVSTRGMGVIKEKKKDISIVGPGFRLTTVDVVQDPSAPSAFVNGIMEGVEFHRNGDEWVEEKTDALKRKYHGMTTTQIAESQAKDFADFLSAIRNG